MAFNAKIYILRVGTVNNINCIDYVYVSKVEHLSIMREGCFEQILLICVGLPSINIFH